MLLMQKGALSTAEVCEALGMSSLKNRKWHVQGAIAIRGEGLYEGLDWYARADHAACLAPVALVEYNLSYCFDRVGGMHLLLSLDCTTRWLCGQILQGLAVTDFYLSIALTGCFMQAGQHSQVNAAVRTDHQRDCGYQMSRLACKA